MSLGIQRNEVNFLIAEMHKIRKPLCYGYLLIDIINFIRTTIYERGEVDESTSSSIE